MPRFLVPFVCFVCALAGGAGDIACLAAVPTFATTVPPDGTEVSLMTDLQKEFALMPMDVRRKNFADAEYRRRLAEGKWYQRPVRLVWTWNSPETEGRPLFSVEVTRAKDGLPVALLSSATTNAVVDNLEIATEYVWHVTPVLMGRRLDMQASGRFTTAGYAPRTLRIDGVANARDLGGRVGFGGRRVRQGLVFRSAGLNANAKDGQKGRQGQDGVAGVHAQRTSWRLRKRTLSRLGGDGLLEPSHRLRTQGTPGQSCEMFRQI